MVTLEIAAAKPEFAPVEGEPHRVYGRSLTFPISAELGPRVSIGYPYLPANFDITIAGEGQDPQTLMISSSSTTFARSWVPQDGRAITLEALPDSDHRFSHYTSEGADKLHVSTGEVYEVIVGQNPDGVFADVWLDKAELPSWRVTVPIEGLKVDVINARLLTPTQG